MAPRHRQLHAHCYRMLGSPFDADDALQETLLAAWRGLAAFESRSALGTWLYRIATHVCLRLLEQRPRRMTSPDHAPPLEATAELGEMVAGPVWLEPSQPIVVLVVFRRPDDVLDLLPGGVADFQAIVVSTIRAESNIEDQRRSIANDVAFVAMLDERRVAEELDVVGRKREAGNDRARIDEQVISGRGSLVTSLQHRLQPIHERLRLRKDQNVFALE